jgi:O-antigen/teichoic acid export membrane protein
MNKIKETANKIIFKIGKLLKTDAKYLINGFFWLSLGQILSSIAGLVSAYFFANYFSKENYGILTYCISLLGILNITALYGANASIIRHVARGEDGVFFPIFKERIKWATLGALSSLIFGLWQWHNGNDTLAAALIVIAIFVPIIEPLTCYASLVNGRKNYRLLAVYNTITRFGPMIFIVMALFFSSKLLIVLLAYLLSHTLFRLMLFIYTLKKYPVKEKNNPDAIKLTRHLSLLGAFGQVSGEIDKLILFHFLGPLQLAVYSFATIPIAQMKKPNSIIGSLMLPKLSQNNLEELKKTLPRKMLIYFLFLLISVCLYILIAPFAYKLLFPQYLGSVFYSQVLAVSILLLPTSFIYQALVSQAAQKELYVSNISSTILKTILLLILIPLFKIWGVIIAVLSSELLLLLLSLIVFKRAKNNPITHPLNEKI